MGHSSNQNSIDEFIAICSCQGMPQYATEAFSMLFPDTPHPVMLVGNKQILDEANRRQDALSPILLGISKNKENFAFFVKLTDEGPELWDLRKGIRIP